MTDTINISKYVKQESSTISGSFEVEDGVLVSYIFTYRYLKPNITKSVEILEDLTEDEKEEYENIILNNFDIVVEEED